MLGLDDLVLDDFDGQFVEFVPAAEVAGHFVGIVVVPASDGGYLIDKNSFLPSDSYIYR